MKGGIWLFCVKANPSLKSDHVRAPAQDQSFLLWQWSIFWIVVVRKEKKFLRMFLELQFYCSYSSVLLPELLCSKVSHYEWVVLTILTRSMVMYCLSSTLAFPLESTDRRGPTVVAVLLGFGGGNTTAAGIILEEENPKFIRVDSKDIPEVLQKPMIIFSILTMWEFLLNTLGKDILKVQTKVNYRGILKGKTLQIFGKL